MKDKIQRASVKVKSVFVLVFVMMFWALKQILFHLSACKLDTPKLLTCNLTSGAREVCVPAVPLLVSAGSAPGPCPPQPLPGVWPQLLVSAQAGHSGGQDCSGEDSGWVFTIIIHATKIISKSINR